MNSSFITTLSSESEDIYSMTKGSLSLLITVIILFVCLVFVCTIGCIEKNLCCCIYNNSNRDYRCKYKYKDICQKKYKKKYNNKDKIYPVN